MTFKILSLDGGGIRGVLSARILQSVEMELEQKRNQKVHEYFNMVSGTSTGSLIAGGVAVKMSARELLDVYKYRGNEIFPAFTRWQRKFRLISQFVGANVLYPHGDPSTGKPGLSTVINEEYGKKCGGSCPTISAIESPIVVIPAYDTLSRNTTLFVSNNSKEDPSWYDLLPLWQVCTASASAPTFFPPYELPYYQDVVPGQVLPHIDGGVSANNPAIAAIAHALLTEEPDITKISVLSIGTGQATRPYSYKQIKNWGLLKWIENLPNIFMAPPAELTNALSLQILDSVGGGDYLRLDCALNQYFEGKRIPKTLRQQSANPKNQYLGREVPEEIDDPNAYQALVDAADAYVEKGTVFYKNKQLSVMQAIAQFIHEHE
ncbi:MAG: patatin-like phospholipase family protein [Cyanobacteria bacterium P01_F01_bin.150]